MGGADRGEPCQHVSPGTRIFYPYFDNNGRSSGQISIVTEAERLIQALARAREGKVGGGRYFARINTPSGRSLDITDQPLAYQETTTCIY
jgi:hypothetical protein